MASLTLPLLIEPAELPLPLNSEQVRLVDLCSTAQYQAGHIPGAVHLAPARTASPAPRPGPLPGLPELQAIFAELGHRDDLHYVVYDDEGKIVGILWGVDVEHRPDLQVIGNLIWVQPIQALNLDHSLEALCRSGVVKAKACR